MKFSPRLSNLSSRMAIGLTLSLALSVSLVHLAGAQAEGDLKSESESQQTPSTPSSDDSMNSLWAEPQDSQKSKSPEKSDRSEKLDDSEKKSKSKSKSKSKNKSASETKIDALPSNDSKPIDLTPSGSSEIPVTPSTVPDSTKESDLSTPILVQPAPTAGSETLITDVSGLCSLSAFKNSDLLRSSAWPGVGPFTAESDNKYVDPQDNKLKLHVDGDHITACELLLNNQNGSKQSVLNLEMTCDFMLEALGAKGNKISEFNSYFEKNKDKIAASKANSESQVKTSTGAYVIALAGVGQSSSNAVLIQVTSKNKSLTDEQSLVSSIKPADSNQPDTTNEVPAVATAAITRPPATTTKPTKTGVSINTVKPTTVTKPVNKPAVKPAKPDTTEASTEPVKTEPQAATKDPLRDELAGAIRSWQTIKKSALKDRNPANLSKILSGDLLKRQTDSIRALTESKHYYELTPKGVVVEKYTELSSSPQKYSVYAKVMELTKIMKDGATKPDKETDDTYNVNYTVERSGDHWTISNSLLLVKKK